MIFDTNVEY